MDLDESAVKHFYLNNLKIKDKVDRNIFDSPFMKGTSYSLSPTKSLSEPPMYKSNEILHFVSELIENEDSKCEAKINLFLAKMFNCEIVFFIFKDPEEKNYFITSIGNNSLSSKEDFYFDNLRKASKNKLFEKDILEENKIKKLITEHYNKPIRTSLAIYSSSKIEGYRMSFFVILLNKCISLNNLEPALKIQNQRLHKMYAEFTPEDANLLKNMLKLIMPITISSIVKGSSERITFLPKMARHIINACNENITWLEAVTKIALKYLNIESIGIYSLKKDQKNFEGILAAKNPDDNPQMVVIPVDYGIVGLVFAQKKSILFNDPSMQLFSSKFMVKNIFQLTIQNIFCAPIKIGKEIKGVIQIINKKESIESTDIDDVVAIARLCALGLSKSS